jgi:hypothetical protein
MNEQSLICNKEWLSLESDRYDFSINIFSLLISVSIYLSELYLYMPRVI